MAVKATRAAQKRGIVHVWVGGMSLRGFFGSVQACGESISMSAGVWVEVK